MQMSFNARTGFTEAKQIPNACCTLRMAAQICQGSQLGIVDWGASRGFLPKFKNSNAGKKNLFSNKWIFCFVAFVLVSCWGCFLTVSFGSLLVWGSVCGGSSEVGMSQTSSNIFRNMQGEGNLGKFEKESQGALTTGMRSDAVEDQASSCLPLILLDQTTVQWLVHLLFERRR